jgi:hypothetical protein
MSYDLRRDFQMDITFIHRQPMKSNLQKSNGLDAFFKSKRHQFVPTLTDFRELGRSSALTARTNKADNNDRALLKFTHRMPIENIFFTSRPCHALQWRSCALEPRAIAGVWRQLSNAYLNSSYADVLLTAMNVIVAWLERRAPAYFLCKWGV